MWVWVKHNEWLLFCNISQHLKGKPGAQRAVYISRCGYTAGPTSCHVVEISWIGSGDGCPIKMAKWIVEIIKMHSFHCWLLASLIRTKSTIRSTLSESAFSLMKPYPRPSANTRSLDGQEHSRLSNSSKIRHHLWSIQCETIVSSSDSQGTKLATKLYNIYYFNSRINLKEL